MIDTLERRTHFAADLAGSFTSAIPTELTPGERNRITLSVTNTGDAPAVGPIVVALFASLDDTFDSNDVNLGSATRGGTIRPGRAARVTFKFPSPINVPDGNYRLLAQLDTTGAVPENEEVDNNVVAAGGLTQIRLPFVDIATSVPAPTFQTIELSPRQKPVRVTVLLTNNGNIPARGPLGLALFASTDQNPDASDVALPPGVSTNVNIKPGRSKALKLKVTAPEALAPGTYFLVGQVNPVAFDDTNASNDAGVSPVPVQFTSTSPL